MFQDQTSYEVKPVSERSLDSLDPVLDRGARTRERIRRIF